MRTPDLLAETGYRYTLNWCHDDQPTWLATRAGPILAVPYPQELNDIPAVVARKVGASEFADMIVDQLEEMLEQSERQPLVMGVALVFLFTRMLAEADREDERAERYEEAASRS